MRDPVTQATQALQAGRWETARRLFAAAVERDRTAEAMDGLGEALWWLGDPRASLGWRQRAYVAWCRAGNSQPQAVRAAIGVAITYESNFANHAAAAGWAARAQRVAARAEPTAGPLTAWVWIVQAYLRTNPVEAADLARRALRIGRAAEDVDLELCSLTGLGRALVAAGRVDDGMAMIDEAMSAVSAGENRLLDTVVYTGCDMLVACDLANDVRRAAQWCQTADEFVRRYGCPFLYARCRALYGGVLVSTGQWPAAEEQLTSAIDMAAGAGPAVRADAVARLADLRLRQGRLAEAEELLDGCEVPLVAATVAATARLARGSPDAAIDLLDRRLGQTLGAQTPGARPERAAALRLLVEAHLGRGDATSARAALDRLVVLADGRGAGRTAALAALGAGQIAAFEADRAGALRHLTRAVDAFARLDLPYETAQVRLRLAEVLAAANPEAAAAEAANAEAALRRLGASVGPPGRSAPPLSPALPGSLTVLTGREREVLRLLAGGLSNPEIAERLIISPRTAAHHVSNILTKLGLRNRVEAAAYATRFDAHI